ncbi:hypothetical protein LTR84_002346 [Exophiala bonariae]|uniref:DUF1996 domain-containing protein n=1 Tax=Exophiala bonariae TaxID=1690606 RepID=A0AAV9N9H5_9EURO|nr:hypothetical protein LTR84_002346 [Exophiala bonariae]
MACSVSQTSRIDPIVDPGAVSGHAHKFAGGNNVNQNSDFNSLLSSTCSSCEVQSDKSAYWTPQLYYAHTNGKFEEVPNYGMTVYYVGRGGTPDNTKPFPPGFKMISGDSEARSYDSSTLTYLNTRPVADRVSFRCINEANDIPEQHYMFRTDCVNGMRAQINFQSCWDGVNLYLPQSAHVAYVSGIDYGSCPPSHPVPIPGLFFEVLYFTNQIDQSGGGEFVFANGDATGYGFHADFINGWEMDIQDDAVKNCLYTDDGGVISACPYLAPSQDVNFARTCPQQPSVFNEQVLGTLDALPGCNPITHGPVRAEQETCPIGQHTPGGASASSQTSATLGPTTAESTSPASSSSQSGGLSTLVSSSSILPTLPTSSAFMSTSVTVSAPTVSTVTQTNSIPDTSSLLSPSQDPSFSVPGTFSSAPFTNFTTLPSSAFSSGADSNSAINTASTTNVIDGGSSSAPATMTMSSALGGNTDAPAPTITFTGGNHGGIRPTFSAPGFFTAPGEATVVTVVMSYTTITITIPFGRAGGFFAATTTPSPVVQTAVPAIDSVPVNMTVSAADGFLTITGATTTTFSPGETTNLAAEETSTTTIYTTITIYETVTPTSTTTIGLATSSESAPTAAATVNSEAAALTTSTSSFISSTISIDNALGCSLYSEYSLQGCATSATATGAVATAFVTVTSPLTEEITSTTLTTLVLSTAASNTTFFTIRGRAVTLIGS